MWNFVIFENSEFEIAVFFFLIHWLNKLVEWNKFEVVAVFVEKIAI